MIHQSSQETHEGLDYGMAEGLDKMDIFMRYLTRRNYRTFLTDIRVALVIASTVFNSIKICHVKIISVYWGFLIHCLAYIL